MLTGCISYRSLLVITYYNLHEHTSLYRVKQCVYVSLEDYEAVLLTCAH